MATKVWCRSTPGIPYSSSSGRAGRQRDRDGILLLGLGDLARAACPAQAVRRIGSREVRVVGDLVVGELMVVRGRDVDEALRTYRFDEALHRRRRLLGAGNVQLPVR